MSGKNQFHMDMFTDLINTIDKEIGNEHADIVPFGEWPLSLPIILDGKPFTFLKHEYLIEPYHDDHPFQVEIKATQLGLTTKAILKQFYRARYESEKYRRGIGYYFPSRTDVTELTKTRINPLVEDNQSSIGTWLQDVDSANVKMIWNTPLYLRGMRSRVGMKSVALDAVVFDELDEAPQNSIDMILERMGHSDAGDLMFLSNPTLPDYGIDRLFQTTDQQYFLLKCPKCNEYTDLVGSFPDCLVTLNGGRVIRACCKCGAELNPSKGQWVAKYPNRTERRGRQFSQLFSQSRTSTPEAILHKFNTTNNLTDFYNLKLGIAYVESQNRLSVQEVLDCCGDGGLQSGSEDLCYMGVDQGNYLHVTIAKRHPKKFGEIIYMAQLKGNKSNDSDDESYWQELDSLMKRFKVGRCVVDAMPNKKNARKFAERNRGRVYLCYYNEHQKGSLKWSDKDLTVMGNRTETLDISHNVVSRGNIILPRKGLDIVNKFAEHMHNVAKKLHEDDETGSQQYLYFKLGEDHFRHSFNYLVMGMTAPDLFFPELL